MTVCWLFHYSLLITRYVVVAEVLPSPEACMFRNKVNILKLEFRHLIHEDQFFT